MFLKLVMDQKSQKLGHVTCPNFTYFGFLTPLRLFLVYPHNLEKDASAFFRPIAKKL